MKKLILPIFILLFSSTLKAQYDSPVEYMAFFNEYYKNISETSWEYTSAVARGKKAKKIEKNRQELITSITNAKQEVSKLKPYKNDSGLKDKILEYLDLSLNVIKEDYGKIMDLEDIAEQSYDLMEAYIFAKEEARRKIDEAQEVVKNEEKRFAEANNVILTTENSDLKRKHEKANKVFDYYNDMYLIFFKSFKNDLYLTEANQYLNLSSIEQTKTSAVDYAEEGKSKMNNLGAFDGDKSLIKACTDLLNYYQNNAKNTIVQDFILAQEKMEKLKNIMEKKKKSDITQNEVNEYNMSIENYNNLVKTFNENNDKVFKEKSKLLDTWNKDVQSFLDTHTPK